MNFGEFIKSVRESRQKSLRKTAFAIGVSPKFYSNVEKSKSCAFTAERLNLLKDFLQMTPDETFQMYDKAAETYRGINIPQDIAEYVIERDYVVSALRFLKDMNADQSDWEYILEILIERHESR